MYHLINRNNYQIKKQNFLLNINPAVKIILFFLVFKIIFSLNIDFNINLLQKYDLFCFLYFLFITSLLTFLLFYVNFSFFKLLKKIFYFKFVIILSLVINLQTSISDVNTNQYFRFYTVDMNIFYFFLIFLFLFFLGSDLWFKKIIWFLCLFFFFFLPLIYGSKLDIFPSNWKFFGIKTLFLSKIYVWKFILICIRIYLFIILNILISQTTSFIDIHDGLEILLKPLKKINIPVEIFSLMISLIFTSIPFLLEITQKVLKAQVSRGLDLNTKKINKRIYYLLSLLIPIFVLSLKKSFVLANAMETRGYVLGKKRTNLTNYNLNLIDYYCGSIILFLFLLSFLK
ncbi:MAG: energy-coupling factor transporter transmembrane component T [Vigna little leaf phytoplasma]|nr:energy-coupling factor transporter transmembrane component T [Vigna little leaf phytoplasma]